MELATATAQAEKGWPRNLRLSIAGSRVFWLGMGLTAAGVAIRFPTLGLQSYHHDEVVTAARVLPGSFGHMLREVHRSESTPWLYYVLAWGWSKAFGLGEFGLRSLSAVFGTVTIPVAYLIGRELAGRRAGLMTMAFAVVNPMLIWYSQEARAYSLLVLFCSLSLLFFLRFRRTAAGSDLALWSLSSALALASHYFAAFPIAIEAGWLLLETGPRRRLLVALGGIAATAALLAPLALHQAANSTHFDWIAVTPLLDRLEDAGYSIFIGETGKVIGAAGPREGYALLPGLLAAAIAALALLRGRGGTRRGIAVAWAIGAATIALAVTAALLGHDFVLARNMLPALPALLAGLGVAAAGIRPRGVGTVLATGLCAYWALFAVHVDTTAGLQRPEWRQIAARLGSPRHPRAIVTWTLGDAPLRFYLHDGAEHVGPGKGPLRVPEVDLVTKRGDVRAPDLLEGRFPHREVVPLGRFTLIRYRAPRRQVLGLRLLRHLPTGFAGNSVIIDGRSRAASARFRPGLPGLAKGPELVAQEAERHRNHHRDRLRLQLRQLRRDEKLKGDQVHRQRRHADRKEAGHLKVGRRRSGSEGPVAVP